MAVACTAHSAFAKASAGAPGTINGSGTSPN